VRGDDGWHRGCRGGTCGAGRWRIVSFHAVWQCRGDLAVFNQDEFGVRKPQKRKTSVQDHFFVGYAPEDERLEHFIMEVWFRSFSFLFMGDL